MLLIIVIIVIVNIFFLIAENIHNIRANLQEEVFQWDHHIESKENA